MSELELEDAESDGSGKECF